MSAPAVHDELTGSFLPAARDARKLARSVIERLSGKPKGDPVHEGSVDIDDERARVHAPLGATVEDTLDVRDAFLAMLKRLQRETIGHQPRSHGVVGRAAIAVFEATFWSTVGFDFYTGTSDLAESQIATDAGVRRGSVNGAKQQLRQLTNGAFNWQRRSIATGWEKAQGVPQRIEISCVYSLRPEHLPPPVHAIFEEELVRLRADRARREQRNGTVGRRRPLVKRDRNDEAKRRARHVPAKLCRGGWKRANELREDALAKIEREKADALAKALAYSTAYARRGDAICP